MKPYLLNKSKITLLLFFLSSSLFFAQTTERHRYWLRLSSPTNTNINQILIAYITGATNGVDPQYDALMLGNDNISIYTTIHNADTRYSIQGKKIPFNDNDLVSLGFNTNSAGTYTLALTNFDGNFATSYNIFIEDTFNNIIHDLKNSSYTFYSDEGIFKNRFLLRYKNTSNCESTTIWNGLTWNNGLPNSTKKTIIRGDYSSIGNLEMCELEIQSGNTLLNSGHDFTVLNNISISPNATLTSQPNSNIIQLESTNNIKNAGEANANINSTPIKRLDYLLWSSPTEDTKILNFSPNTLTNRIYVYNGALGYVNTDFNGNVFNNTSSFELGKGYLFRAPNNFHSENKISYTASYFGELHNGNISTTVIPNQFTSIGNPYLSGISASNFLNDNPNISSIYLWTNTHPYNNVTQNYDGNNYVIINNLGTISVSNQDTTNYSIIPPGQGFIVKEINSTENVIFKNSQRISTNYNTISKNNQSKNRYWINFSTNEDKIISQILIGHTPEGTNGVDNQLDSAIITTNSDQLYSIIKSSTDKFAIQTKGFPITDEETIELGYQITQNGYYKISINNTDGIFKNDQDIFLKDKFLNIEYNLKESPYYFYSQEGSEKERFEIIYQKKQKDNLNNNSTNWTAIKTETGIIIKSDNDDIDLVEIFDLSGRLLYSKKYESVSDININPININQILIIKITNKNSSSSVKKI